MTTDNPFGAASLEFRETHGGPNEISSKQKITTKEILATHYTPGIGAVASHIADAPEESFRLTQRRNTVAVVSDGSAVLGLGRIGPLGALPVMEGKSMILKQLADIDAIPIVLDTHDVDEIIETVVRIAPSFGGIHLEDIGAPACFAVEDRLSEILDIPVFHDDQHGTAIVVLAALINACHVVKKSKEDLKIVINGAGAAGIAIAKLITKWGVGELVLLDSRGIISHRRKSEQNLPEYKTQFATESDGNLADALVGADVLVGVSKPGLVTQDMVRSMAPDSIVCGLANPIPEIFPDAAHAAGARITATGRSDFANQINNALVFPGLFRGLLDHRVPRMTVDINLAVAQALASLVPDPTETRLLPDIFDPVVPQTVADTIGSIASGGGGR